MYKKHKIVNLSFLPDFNFGLLGCSLLEVFGWIYFLSLGLTPRKLVLTFALCFPTCVTYIVLDGNGVTGRGAHGVVILGGWLDWSVIRLARPLCPVPTCLRIKRLFPGSDQRPIFPFSCCATRTGILKWVLCISLPST